MGWKDNDRLGLPLVSMMILLVNPKSRVFLCVMYGVDITPICTGVASMGIGVLGSAIPVLLYQGSLTLLASKIQSFFTPGMVRELTSVGGVIVMGIRS